MNRTLIENIKQILLIGDLELTHIIDDDENPPLFYRPKQALRVSKWLKRLSVLILIIINLLNLTQIGYLQQTIQSFFQSGQNSQILSWLLTAVIGLIALVLQSFIYFFALQAMSWILLILMDMEFSSRKP